MIRRTRITLEILSDTKEYPETVSLDELAFRVMHRMWSGRTINVTREILRSKEEVIEAIEEHNCDPEIFGIEPEEDNDLRTYH